MTDHTHNADTWAEHMRSEFETLDVEQTLETMTPEPYDLAQRSRNYCRHSPLNPMAQPTPPRDAARCRGCGRSR